MSSKLTFSLKAKSGSSKKGPLSSSAAKTKKLALDGFDEIHEQASTGEQFVHPDLKEPLVIPVQRDSRQSLQEQAKAKRDQEGKEAEKLSKEDQEAIEALKRDASGKSPAESSRNSKIIKAIENTFQSAEQKESEQFQEDLEKLAPDLSVDSESYQKVPITDFGAALLRGMGWKGSVDKNDVASNLPRPSRLGLGATPKLLDVPTHKRGRRRQDQVQRDKQLKEQQHDYEMQRQKQLRQDKQRTIQVGSIVLVEGDRDRAIIRQWNGVPGLNMISVQFEGDKKPTKVKKRSVQLLSRQKLEEQPFHKPEYSKSQKTEYIGQKEQKGDKEKERRHRREVYRRERNSDKGRSLRDVDQNDDRREPRRDRDYEDDYKRNTKRYDDDMKRYRRSEEDDQQRQKYDRDRDRRSSREPGDRESKKRRSHNDYDQSSSKRSRNHFSSSEKKRPSTWLIPSIRVRVITSKYGRSHDKKKGIVVDVTVKGATLKMENGNILQDIPERYLETALPKMGGNAVILVGEHRFAKGRLLERDTRANKGAIQLFEDMNIVTTVLDDMAEWCLPLDDDLMD
jgi:G patch domain/KOW motif-containing protein